MSTTPEVKINGVYLTESQVLALHTAVTCDLASLTSTPCQREHLREIDRILDSPGPIHLLQLDKRLCSVASGRWTKAFSDVTCSECKGHMAVWGSHSAPSFTLQLRPLSGAWVELKFSSEDYAVASVAPGKHE